MGSWGKAMVVVAVALLLAGGGAAAWVAASDDDEGSPFGESGVGGPEAAPPAPSDAPPAPGPTAQQPEPNLDPEAEQADEAPSGGTSGGDASGADAPGGGPRKTRFPRERGQAEQDSPKREFAIPPAREFSGVGNATLGRIDVSRSAVVKWKTSGRFELRFGRESFPIIAPSPSGELVVPPYDFEQVRVVAKGRWTITITPER